MKTMKIAAMTALAVLVGGECAAATFAHTIYGGDYTCRNVATLDEAEFAAVTNLCPLALAAYPEKYEVFSGEVLRSMGYEELSEEQTRVLVKDAPGLTVHAVGGHCTVVRESADADDHSLQARMFRSLKDGTLVVSFRGSEESVDWKDDAQQIAMMGLPQQYSDASSLLASVLSNTASRIVVVGHSLGGGLTQYAIAASDCAGRVKGYTYNSAGLSMRTVEEVERANASAAGYAAKHVTGIRNRMDPVSFVGFHYGEMYDVTATASARNARTAHGGDSIAEGLAQTTRGVVVEAALTLNEVKEILSLYDDPAIFARIESDMHLAVADIYGAASKAATAAGAAAGAAAETAMRLVPFQGTNGVFRGKTE